MTRFDAVSSEVLLQNRVRPKFVRVPQIFGLLTGAMPHPGDCIVRNAAAFPRSRKLSQRRLQTELKVFLHTQCNRVAIHAVTAGDGAITPSAGGVQEDRGVHYLSSLSTTGTAKTSSCSFCSAERIKGCRFVKNGINHSCTKLFLWYRYRQNAILVTREARPASSRASGNSAPSMPPHIRRSRPPSGEPSSSRSSPARWSRWPRS